MYSSKIFNEFKNNTKLIWRKLRELQNKPYKTNSNYPIMIKDKLLTSNLDIANQFNNFYCNIAPSLDQKLRSTTKNPMSYLTGDFVNSMSVPLVTEHDVVIAIKSLKNKKSGSLHFPINIIKANAIHLSVPLALLFNQSVRLGLFPNCFKHANIIPIYKKGPKSEVENYRPISILNNFSKIFETLMKKNLLKYLQDNSIISDKQFGFQKGLSTFDPLNILTNDLFNALDNRMSSVCVFVDFSKAFDTVRHDILINKLNHYGIRGVVLEWFKSYLSDRTQSTSIHNVSSLPQKVSYGVPQGSVLGPILFLLFINDLPSIFSSFKSILFADDSSFYVIGPCLKSLIHQANSDLDKFYQWTLSNRLTVNLDKTKYMIVSNKNPKTLPPLFLNFDTISRTRYHKILGIVIDQDLSFKEHINQLCIKLSHSFSLLYQLKDFVTINILRNLYYAHVHPHLIYCLPIWGSTYPTHLQPLFILQKKIIRIITLSNFNEHTEPLFKSTNILKLYDLIKYEIAGYMYRNKNSPHFNRLTHAYNTRNRNSVITPRHSLHLFQNSLAFNGPKIYQSINHTIKSKPTLMLFKKYYSRTIISSYSSTAR